MIFFLNLDGTMIKVSEERIFQGSNNVSAIQFITPFSPPTALQISFTLHNGLTTVPFSMLSLSNG